MRRREFIVLVGGAAIFAPRATRAQQNTDNLPRIGIIQSFPNENFEALTEGLREAGYIDGQNVLMERRFHRAALDRIDAFANELVALKCKVIFCWCAVWDPGCVEGDKYDSDCWCRPGKRPRGQRVGAKPGSSRR